jgi:3-phosphoshikimate 1-carboxyvinyltransferase
MNLRLHRPAQGILSERIHLPGSKSISNRVLIIKALSNLPFFIENLSDSDDTYYLQKALENIESTSLINVGHAGTDMRFLTAFLSLKNGRFELTGSDRLQQRPIKDLVEVLKDLGANIIYKHKEGFPPLILEGRQLSGGNASISGNVSSQFITSLLLVAPYFTNGLRLTIQGELVSAPYVNMTIDIMRAFGASVNWINNQIIVNPVPYSYSKSTYLVEGDWSAASYYYSMIALSEINNNLKLVGLFKNSLQADSVCDLIFKQLGVLTSYGDNEILITKSQLHQRNPLLYNFIQCPDIVQTLACTCMGLKVPFSFSGLQTLKIKETNRLEALQNEFEKFGINLEVKNNCLQYEPINNHVVGPLQIKTYNDHRMAMSFAPLSLLFDFISIEHADVVSKSYPQFWEHLKIIGIHQTPGE